MKFFYLTWSNLKRKKFRTLLTLLSIVVAFVLFGSAALLYFLGEFLPWLKLGVAFMAVTAIVYFVAFVHGNAAEQLGPLARKIKAPKLAPDTVTLAEGPSSTVKG